MSAFDRMKRREAIQGRTPKQEMINNSRHNVDLLLADDPSYNEGVEILGKGLVNLRTNNYRLVQSAPRMDVQASLTEPVVFNLGDVFHYGDNHWLCIKAEDFHGIYRRGEAEACNYLLKWQNPKTMAVHTRWCSVRDPYASGLDDNKVVTTGNAKYKIILPLDPETALFHVDKRFLIDIANNEPIPYSIIKYDSVTNNGGSGGEGFIVINLRESVLESGDNRELMIANYREPVLGAPIGSCSIDYTGEPEIKAGGSVKSFKAVFRNDAGGPAVGITPVWELIPDTGFDVSGVEIEPQTGNEIRIAASPQAGIGGWFVLKVTGFDSLLGSFENSVRVKIGGII